MTKNVTPSELGLSDGAGHSRREIIAALRKIGGVCAQAADMLEEEERIDLMPGDYFTHDRTGARFVCRSVKRHDYDGFQSVPRAEVDFVLLKK